MIREFKIYNPGIWLASQLVSTNLMQRAHSSHSEYSTHPLCSTSVARQRDMSSSQNKGTGVRCDALVAF